MAGYAVLLTGLVLGWAVGGLGGGAIFLLGLVGSGVLLYDRKARLLR